jgi:aminopeptidase N
VPIVFGPLAADSRRDVAVVDGTGELAAGACGDAVKLNLGNNGYYRVAYDAATHSNLAKALGTMAPADRINLLADTWALVEAGRRPAGAYAELVDNLDVDADPWLWEQVIRVVRRIDTLGQGRPQQAAFRGFARSKLRPIFDQLGWQPIAGESAGRARLRGLVIVALGELGDEAILAEAKRRFAAFAADPGSLPSDLHLSVIRLAGRGADRDTHKALIALGRKATSRDKGRQFYSAAAGALDPTVAAQTLSVALNGELSGDVTASLINGVAAEHRDLAWEFVRANLPSLVARHGASFKASLLPKLIENLADQTRAAELASYAPSRDTSGGRAAARATQRVAVNAELATRLLPDLDEWLAQQSPRQ